VLGSSSDAAVFIANDKGYFKDEGIEIDFQRFQSLVDMVAPVSANQLDIATGGLAAGLYNAINRDVQVAVVADKGGTPSPRFEFSSLMIRKDLIDSGKVKDYKDLKGLNLVTSGKGVSPEVSLAFALKKAGLTLNDVNYTNLAFPDMVTAFANKSIDGGIVIEPFVSRIVSEGNGVRWKGNLELIGHNQQIAVIVYGSKVLANKELGQRWMIAYVRALRDYNDAFGERKRGYDEAVQIMVKNTTVKDPKVYDQVLPAGLDPDGKIDRASMQEDLDYYMQSGQVKNPVDLSKLVDTSFQEYAVKTLGPYT
jgi:NitT/TauT family transport system substrate-binding protein